MNFNSLKPLTAIASCCVFVGSVLPANALTLNEEAFDNATVRATGPITPLEGGLAFFNIDGSGNPPFSSYGVADFNFGVLGSAIASVNAISLNLTQANAPFSVDGDLEFFLDTSASLLTLRPHKCGGFLVHRPTLKHPETRSFSPRGRSLPNRRLPCLGAPHPTASI